MHARMTLKHMMAMLVVGLVSACSSSGTLTVTQPKTQEPPTAASVDPATQSPLSSTAPSPLIGKWKGTWESGGRPQVYGQMEMEFEANDDDRVIGQVRVACSPSDSGTWERFVGTKSGEKVSLQYHLGGRCGKVVLNLLIDPKKDNLLSGTYVSEFPGSGTIRLKKQ